MHLRGLEALAREFGQSEGWARRAWDRGTSVEEARAGLERIAQANEAARLASVVAHPDGRPSEAEGVGLALRWLGCADLVSRDRSTPELAAIADAEARGASMVQHGRDGLGRILGLAGPGGELPAAGRWSAFQTARAAAEVRFAALGGRPSAIRRADIGAATQTALHRIVMSQWQRTGSWWRSSVRLLEVPDYRKRRHYFTTAGSAGDSVAYEGGEPPRAPASDYGAWLTADLQVERRRETTTVTHEAVVDAGGVPLMAWVSAQLVLWNDEVDKAVAAVLASAAVPAVDASALAAKLIADGVTALNRQEIGGAPLGSVRPILVCSEEQRGLVGALVPAIARAAEDDSRLVQRAEYSASAPDDTRVLVHPDHLPVAITFTEGGIEPRVVWGPFAGVQRNGKLIDDGAVVVQSRSAPALLVNAAGNARGAVRLTVTP